MDEGGVALAERPQPLQDNPEKQLELRDALKEMVYSDAVRKREGANLPGTGAQLLKMWDEQVKENAEERAQTKEKDLEKVPNIVLRELKEDDPIWEEVLGWPKADREKVKKELSDVLGLKEPYLTHALESLIASGQKPEQAISLINKENYDQIYNGLPDRDYRQSEVTAEDKKLATKTLFLEELLGGLKNKQRYIKRFILYDEYDTRSLPLLADRGGLGMEGYGYSLKDEFNGKLPDNLMDVAWNIGYERKGRYGIDGKMPALRMQVKKNEDGTVEGRYVVDQANFMQWMREQIWTWYDEWDTDAVTDYFAQIKIDKGSFYSLNLASLLFNKKLYFTDEAGQYWGDLWKETLLEPWMMYFMRTYYLEYEKAMGSEEKLAETFNSSFFLSKFSRKLFGSSMINIISTLPTDFVGNQESDTKLGEASQTMFLIYYYMADYKKLWQILGKDSPFFKKDFWVEAIGDVAKSDLDQTGVPKMTQYLGDKLDLFTKIFDEKGEVKDWEKFAKISELFS